MWELTGAQGQISGEQAGEGVGDGVAHGRLPGEAGPHLPQGRVLRAGGEGRVGMGALGRRKGVAKLLRCGSSTMHRHGGGRTHENRKGWLQACLLSWGNGEPWKAFKQGSGMIPFLIK